ncbi:phosphate signaling complex protein PhoU [Candidatus Contendibacter odensensis]|uniref:Phosphate-specific transport system accessory protein PhoU n=1 Tax=Candidatus Contendobacter odensis Run_B_J11 TaxID=1400861 RepID=A0A7U7GE34_9GAMM|nr:phosphate signaling complex protein PhoU [Candidatus Contendobacter odensis]CDH46691.1 negative regulator of PhoR/PhoB two-component regulator [Candidatus Contendobacter odensis Run_B_J11]
MAMSQDAHTVKQFDVQLANLRSLVLEMGGLVEKQIENAIQALNDENLTAAREVIARDHVINGLQVKSDEDSVNLIALRQPLGSDLRMVMSLSNITTDLERIGDGAKKIARMTIQIYEGVGSPPSARLLRDIMPMSKLAIEMLHNSLDALARLNTEKALQVTKRDGDLDEEFQAALRRLMTYMMEDSRTIGHAINVIFAVKALERIGDHCKNIAEHIVYMVEGKNIRHRNIDTRRDVAAQDTLEK